MRAGDGTGLGLTRVEGAMRAGEAVETECQTTKQKGLGKHANPGCRRAGLVNLRLGN